MIRALTILAAVVALAVSASPASASGKDDTPTESISFSYLKAGLPKPPGLGTPSGGEVISDFAKAQRTQPSVVVLIGANNYG